MKHDACIHLYETPSPVLTLVDLGFIGLHNVITN